MEIRVYKDKEEVASKFCKYFAKLVEGKKEVHIALSGGSTPKIVFDVLAASYAKEIDWKSLHFYWGDERCVPPTDNESNYKMTVEHLFSKIDVPENNIHRIKGENAPKEEALRYGQLLKERLPEVGGVPQFDLVVLGMGDDGHTASIFPHQIRLWNSNTVCEVAQHPISGQKRITLTGSVINNAKTVAFLVTGENKAKKVSIVVRQEAGHEKYPASLVAPSSRALFWFLDNAAAQIILGRS